jgi:hypothetical protein
MARACRRFGRTGSTVHAPRWWLSGVTSAGRTEADGLVTLTEDECACAKVRVAARPPRWRMIDRTRNACGDVVERGIGAPVASKTASPLRREARPRELR